MKIKLWILLLTAVTCINVYADDQVISSRIEAKHLIKPQETEGFCFAIFSDRTSGDDKFGYEVFEKAIEQVNGMRPKFVCSIGDLIQGYGSEKEWISEAEKFERTVEKLQVPFYPVAGNHEIYWFRDTKERPNTQHEKDYEKYFGPLWYAFEYDNCRFISLFSDEGDHESGQKGYHRPELQKISDEQFDWLKSVLEKNKDADHIFIFQHHPRWNRANYGDDWDRVHRMLVEAANVSAVFAGHLHHEDYQRIDGIDYYTLGTTGGGISDLCQSCDQRWYWVAVTGDKYHVTAVPVDSLKDPKQVSIRTTTAVQLQKWNITKPDQVIEYELSTVGIENEKVQINTMIADAWDESGDNGVTALMLDENKNVIFERLLKHKGQQWFSANLESGKIYYVQLKDPDADFEGQQAGNEGEIFIQLKYYPQ